MMIRNPTVHIPRWDDHPTPSIHPSFAAVSPTGNDSLAALQRYLPSNLDPDWDDDLDIPVDAFSCDQFRMFEFKVKRCARARSHDWTECPYAHPGEKARRRDPCKYSYSGSSCPEYRKGGCRKGDLCEFAHGVFECWLHPDRYRTQACKDGTQCRRRVCFFAHTPEQLRIIPGCFDSPTSVLHSPPESPPMSPSEALRMNSVSGVALSMRNLHIAGNMRMGPFTRRPGFTIPTGSFDPPMERVESGRDLRARMYAKLSMDNSVDSASPVPDFGWIAELVN